MLASVGLSSEFMVEQVRTAVDMVVSVGRRPDGTRGIEAVVEVGETSEQDRWLVRGAVVVAASRPAEAGGLLENAGLLEDAGLLSGCARTLTLRGGSDG